MHCVHFVFWRAACSCAECIIPFSPLPPCPDLDELLERILLFLDESGGVPVLLSMLVLIFRSMTDLERLPHNRMELYQRAIEAALDPQELGIDQLDVCMRMLRHIAVANHTRLRRQFPPRHGLVWPL